MTIKAGDLVILVRATNPKLVQHIGEIRTVVRPSDYIGGAWYLDPPVFGMNGLQASWREGDMRRIDNPGDDAVDEVIQRIGTPHKETA